MNYTLTNLFGRPYVAVDNRIEALTDEFAGVASLITPINLTMLLVLLIFTMFLLVLFVKKVLA